MVLGLIHVLTMAPHSCWIGSLVSPHLSHCGERPRLITPAAPTRPRSTSASTAASVITTAMTRGGSSQVVLQGERRATHGSHLLQGGRSAPHRDFLRTSERPINDDS
jgi:hypothetical protein